MECKSAQLEAGVRNAAATPRGVFATWQARQLTTHVDARLTGRIYIRDLAACLNLSIGHFTRLFASTFGLPAQTWIRRRRIELAQALMLITEAPLCAISLSCGMSDQSHFTRTFRRLVGETPNVWRKSRCAAVSRPVGHDTERGDRRMSFR